MRGRALSLEMHGVQGVGSSNLLAPTKFNEYGDPERLPEDEPDADAAIVAARSAKDKPKLVIIAIRPSDDDRSARRVVGGSGVTVGPFLLTDAAVAYGAPHERPVGNTSGNRGRASVVFHGKLAHSAFVVKLGHALAVEHEPALSVNAIGSSDFIVRANARHAEVGEPMDRVTFNGALRSRFIGSNADASGADEDRRQHQRAIHW
jgi:hypothetical protein